MRINRQGERLGVQGAEGSRGLSDSAFPRRRGWESFRFLRQFAGFQALSRQLSAVPGFGVFVAFRPFSSVRLCLSPSPIECRTTCRPTECAQRLSNDRKAACVTGERDAGTLGGAGRRPIQVSGDRQAAVNFVHPLPDLISVSWHSRSHPRHCRSRYS